MLQNNILGLEMLFQNVKTETLAEDLIFQATFRDRSSFTIIITSLYFLFF